MVSLQQKKIRALANRWVDLWDRQNDLDARRMYVGTKLLRAMKRARMSHVGLSDGRAILHVSGKQRRPSKQDLVDFLGEKKAESLWASIPERLVEYLSVTLRRG